MINNVPLVVGALKYYFKIIYMSYFALIITMVIDIQLFCIIFIVCANGVIDFQ